MQISQQWTTQFRSDIRWGAPKNYTLPKRVKMADWILKENKHQQLNWSGIINTSNLFNNRDCQAILRFSELTVSECLMEKRSILGWKTGTMLYQRSIEHRIICHRVLKAFHCTLLLHIETVWSLKDNFIFGIFKVLQCMALGASLGNCLRFSFARRVYYWLTQ